MSRDSVAHGRESMLGCVQNAVAQQDQHVGDRHSEHVLHGCGGDWPVVEIIGGQKPGDTVQVGSNLKGLLRWVNGKRHRGDRFTTENTERTEKSKRLSGSRFLFDPVFSVTSVFFVVKKSEFLPA